MVTVLFRFKQTKLFGYRWPTAFEPIEKLFGLTQHSSRHNAFVGFLSNLKLNFIAKTVVEVHPSMVRKPELRQKLMIVVNCFLQVSDYKRKQASLLFPAKLRVAVLNGGRCRTNIDSSENDVDVITPILGKVTFTYCIFAFSLHLPITFCSRCIALCPHFLNYETALYNC